ncbi:MAG: leucyl/phenylalanyl-tRNA--protein transferase [Bacteroidales bacterium]|nr:leucyl/phenylalanyl-tRNA--protein transferase [Bacteroidales bacterium]
MLFALNDDDYLFPDPSNAEGQDSMYPGLLAIGGDLSPGRLMAAYRRGIFPWFDEGEPILWWSLDPRMILLLDQFRYSKSLRRTVESGRFEVRVDTCFEQVIRSCAAVSREGQNGTWITEDMIEAYLRLHQMGVAHSFESFLDGTLVGGLYGVSLGRFFSGESMFHTVRDASKVAFVKLVEYSRMHGFYFIDAQQPTAHLASLGAKEMPRGEFLEHLQKALPCNDSPTSKFMAQNSQWHRHSVALSLGGNQGDVAGTMNRACEMISESVGPICCFSRDYESEPWGFDHPVPNFLNRCVVVDTDLSPREVLENIMEIEKRLGRQRSSVSGKGSLQNSQFEIQNSHYSSRPIDIDILFYDSRVLNEPDLQVPHPRLHLRRFVLEPLAELMPSFRHPVLKKSVLELLNECEDEGRVF